MVVPSLSSRRLRKDLRRVPDEKAPMQGIGLGGASDIQFVGKESETSLRRWTCCPYLSLLYAVTGTNHGKESA